MKRKIFDREAFEAKKPDGVHCVVCGKKLPTRQHKKYCSWQCSVKLQETVNWNYLKEKILKRDQHTCADCRITATKLAELEQKDRDENWRCPHPQKFWLNVHHVKPIELDGNEFDASNCVTLCHRCHTKRHRELKNEKKRWKLGVKPLEAYK